MGIIAFACSWPQGSEHCLIRTNHQPNLIPLPPRPSPSFVVLVCMQAVDAFWEAGRFELSLNSAPNCSAGSQWLSSSALPCQASAHLADLPDLPSDAPAGMPRNTHATCRVLPPRRRFAARGRRFRRRAAGCTSSLRVYWMRSSRCSGLDPQSEKRRREEQTDTVSHAWRGMLFRKWLWCACACKSTQDNKMRQVD